MSGISMVGVEYLSQASKSGRLTYADYLNDAVLPYMSRDDYIRQHPEAVNLSGESNILEKFLEPDKYGGVMIYGDGGIGKTRLMLELGRLAEKKGWIVYRVTHQLKSLSDLKSCLQSGSSYLLLFDSVEDHPLFASDIIEKLGQMVLDTLKEATVA